MAVILVLLILFQPGYQLEINHWGNHFVLTFLQNGNEEVANTLVITTREKSNISVTFHEINETEIIYLNANESHSVFFNGSTTAKPSLQVLPLKAVSIEASKAVSVYGFTESLDPISPSKDGFLVLPVPSLGVEYIAFTCEENGPQIAIAAVENKTEVEIKIRCNVEVQCYQGLNVSNYTDNHVLTFTLNAHDVVNLYCLGETTGSIVHSTKPITVISGCNCVRGPYTIDCDHLAEMMPPTTEQGNQFVAAQPASASLTVLRIVSTNNVTVHDNNGLFYSFQTHSRYLDVITLELELCLTSDKPMLVVMYIGSFESIYTSTSYVDVLMTVVPPLTKYAFNYSINTNFVNPYRAVVTCLRGNCPSNSIDLIQINQTKYYVGRELILGFKTWRSINPFMVIIFGFSSGTIVGYPAGMSITDYSGISECSSNPCYNNGWCLEFGTTYRCRCWDGYNGDQCEIDPFDVQVENVEEPYTVSTLETTSYLQTTDLTTMLMITTDTQKDTKVTHAFAPDILIPTSKSTASTSGSTMSINSASTPSSKIPSATKSVVLIPPESEKTLLIFNSTITSGTHVGTTGATTAQTSTSSVTNIPFITIDSETENDVTDPTLTDVNTTSPFTKTLRLCGCPCSRSAKKHMTAKLKTVEETLQVTKEDLSKEQRRKNSAENVYDSEINLGYSACSMLLFVILLIVITDLSKIISWFFKWKLKKSEDITRI